MLPRGLCVCIDHRICLIWGCVYVLGGIILRRHIPKPMSVWWPQIHRDLEDRAANVHFAPIGNHGACLSTQKLALVHSLLHFCVSYAIVKSVFHFAVFETYYLQKFLPDQNIFRRLCFTCPLAAIATHFRYVRWLFFDLVFLI